MNTSGNDGKYHPVIFLRQSIPQTKNHWQSSKLSYINIGVRGMWVCKEMQWIWQVGGHKELRSKETRIRGPSSLAGSKKGTRHKHPLNGNRKCLKVSNLVPTMKLWANFRTVADTYHLFDEMDLSWGFHTNFEKVCEKVIAICDRASTHFTFTLRTPCTFQLQDCNPFNVRCLVLLAKVWS